MGKSVAPADYSTVILVHLVKLFASPDRGTRLALLEHLSEYSDKLDKKTVGDKIWPHLVRVLSWLRIKAVYGTKMPPANWILGYSCSHSRGYRQVDYPAGRQGIHVSPWLTSISSR